MEMEIIKIYRRSVSNISLESNNDQDKNKKIASSKDFIVIYLTSAGHVPCAEHCDDIKHAHQYFDELEDFVIFEQTVITTYEISK